MSRPTARTQRTYRPTGADWKHAQALGVRFQGAGLYQVLGPQWRHLWLHPHTRQPFVLVLDRETTDEGVAEMLGVEPT